MTVISCDPMSLKNQLCFPLYICSKELTRRYGALLNDIGLTYTQYVVMMYFWEMGTANVKELGEALMLDPSTLTPILKKLEGKGLLRRTRSAEDERVLNVTPTESGMALREKALPFPEEIRRICGLTADESEQLCRLTSKLINNITKEETK
ncbi:MAG: MarR family transcriptional regulator [Ruminiclostridium sp.]|nr:MarR family transcriptional regulator [Ruminiclostridium sp.]